MKGLYKHYAIIFWSRKAEKYNDLVNMYVNDIKGIDYIYATGLMATMRDRYLNIVKELQSK